MKTNKLKKSSISFTMLVLAGILLAPLASFAQQSGNQQSGNTAESSTMIGGISKTALDRINKEGAAKVAAITPTKKSLSQKDQSLLLKVSNGGMKQLMLSQVAVQKTTNDQIRQLAQAEVEEQTGLAAKLKEIASAKGITLPTEVDTDTKEMLTQFNTYTSSELDRYYIAEGGIKGHEELDKVMSSVEAEAQDSNLKSLAAAAHPLILTHLKVSRAMLNTITNPVGNK